jgi:hypothetical protein
MPAGLVGGLGVWGRQICMSYVALPCYPGTGTAGWLLDLLEKTAGLQIIQQGQNFAASI